MVPVPGTLPKLQVSEHLPQAQVPRQEESLLQWPLCIMGITTKLAFCQRECHTAGRGCALALEQKLLGFGRVLIICKVALLELGRVS